MTDSVIEILRNKPIKLCVLGTASSSGQPWCAVVAYAIEDNEKVIICTKKESRKWKNITENSKVALVFGFDMNETNIQCEGTATIIEQGDPYRECENVFYNVNPYAAKYKNEKTIFIMVKLTKGRISELKTFPPSMKEFNI